jgi:hypothetical protein
MVPGCFEVLVMMIELQIGHVILIGADPKVGMEKVLIIGLL